MLGAHACDWRCCVDCHVHNLFADPQFFMLCVRVQCDVRVLVCALSFELARLPVSGCEHWP